VRLRSFCLTTVLFAALGPLLGTLVLHVVPVLFGWGRAEDGWPFTVFLFFYLFFYSLFIYGLPMLAGSLFVGLVVAVHDAVYDETDRLLAVVLAAAGGVVTNVAFSISCQRSAPTPVRRGDLHDLLPHKCALLEAHSMTLFVPPRRFFWPVHRLGSLIALGSARRCHAS
jgi:hypothetical protein